MVFTGKVKRRDLNHIFDPSCVYVAIVLVIKICVDAFWLLLCEQR